MSQRSSTGRKLRCVKCGSDDVRTFWHAGPWGGRSRPECGYGSIVKARGEHLHRYCQGCHYEWADPVLSAEEVAA